jgi:hypothetical protein
MVCQAVALLLILLPGDAVRKAGGFLSDGIGARAQAYRLSTSEAAENGRRVPGGMQPL